MAAQRNIGVSGGNTTRRHGSVAASSNISVTPWRHQ